MCVKEFLLTDLEFAQFIALEHEQSGVEFKGPGSLSNNRFVAQVVKAVLGMANRRDGGTVIIGVEESEGRLKPVGLTDEELDSWSYDAVADRIARYADPSVRIDLEVKEYQGNRYVVILVAEFDDIPVLCKRAFNGVLRNGACYVRTRRKPETSEIPSQAEMRDLLDLATVKWVRLRVDWMQQAGIVPFGVSNPSDADAARFNQEAEEGL